MVSEPAAQSKYQVRFDWGSEGADAVGADADIVVLVDAISFTTTVELAVTHGVEVVPFSGRGSPLDEVARVDGALAGPRGGDGVTLSPSSISPETVATLPPRKRVVMPSLNGSTVSARVAGFGIPVVAASLRNRTAVAAWILNHQAELGKRVSIAIIAAGERRADGSLRFAVEDFLVAGSVVDALAAVGIDFSSPEAATACAAYVGLSGAVGHLMTASVSGQELIAVGQGRDVEIAAQRDISSTVPVLGEFGYHA